MPDWTSWQERINHIAFPQERIRIGVVGKYIDNGAHSMADSYISICHALIHAGAELSTAVDISWLDAKEFEQDDNACAQLDAFHGVIIPGGFGASGVEGKIRAISYVRKKNIPCFGLCYGLHLAAVEFARNVCNLHGAHTTEVNPNTEHPIIDILPIQKEILQDKRYGGTMRLGAYKATLKKGSKVHALYQRACEKEVDEVWERHRHRYEVNPDYVSLLEKHGFIFSGHHVRSDGTQLMEFAEIPTHRFFIGTQAHPEFKSQFGYPNPLFYGFVSACKEYVQEIQDTKTQIQDKQKEQMG